MSLTALQKKTILETLPTGRVFFDFTDRPQYTHDATEVIHLPDALFFAESEDEIVRALRLCHQIGLPLIARGAGTGYSGGVSAVRGGLLLSTERMKSIAIDAERKTAIVGPGTITANVMKAASAAGLFYPPDPASFDESTIGGNLAENAGGLHCKKYGVTKDYVLAFRGVDAAGETVIVDTTSPFGLSDLLVGSEGTLFVFTQIVLRLINQPPSGKTIQVVFSRAVDAASAVAEITAAGIVPSIMEYMDGDAIVCSNQYDTAHRIEEGAAMLLLETDGPRAESEAEQITAICQKLSPQSFNETADPEKRDILWQTRRNLSKAVKSLVKSKVAEDVCVPPSRLPELVSYVEELNHRFTIRVNCYGHAGDGNLHVNFLGMTGSDEENKEISEGVALLFARTLRLGGTLTGEHGIGIAKKDFLANEFTPATLAFMKRLKRALDPHDILNPGKIFV